MGPRLFIQGQTRRVGIFGTLSRQSTFISIVLERAWRQVKAIEKHLLRWNPRAQRGCLEGPFSDEHISIQERARLYLLYYRPPIVTRQSFGDIFLSNDLFSGNIEQTLASVHPVVGLPL